MKGQTPVPTPDPVPANTVWTSLRTFVSLPRSWIEQHSVVIPANTKILSVKSIKYLSLRCWEGFSLVAASRHCSLGGARGLLSAEAPGSRGECLEHSGSGIAARGLYGTGSVVLVLRGPSRSVACGISLDQGSNLCLLHWRADSCPPCHQGGPIQLLWRDFWTLDNVSGSILNPWSLYGRWCVHVQAGAFGGEAAQITAPQNKAWPTAGKQLTSEGMGEAGRQEAHQILKGLCDPQEVRKYYPRLRTHQ